MAAAAADSLLALAAAADAIASCPRRLDKAARLTAYLAPLSDDALRLAARYMAGQSFALWDRRVTQVGVAALLAAMAAHTGRDIATLRAELVRVGDLGDVAGAAWPASPGGCSLADVAAGLAQLAAAPGGAAKGAALRALLAGRAPQEARYLVKLLGGELRIGLREGAIEAALAQLAGCDVGAVQAANMRLGDVGETAVLARHQALASAPVRLYHPLKFMLATAADSASDVARQMPAGGCAVEDKFDGIRCQAHLGPADAAPAGAHGEVHAGVRVALFSRALGNLTASFPELLPPLAALGDAAILDGEIVAVRDGKILPFAELQRRLGRRRPTAALLAETPVALVAFDLLYQGDALQLAAPYTARRAALGRVLARAPHAALRLADSQPLRDAAALDGLFAAARGRGNEGLVLKDPDAPYRPGRRGREWLKVKRAQATLDVVIVGAEVGHGRRAKWLSDYTFAVRRSAADPTLLTIGKAYSGLTDAEVAALTEQLHAETLEVGAHGKWRRVRPTVVLEIACDRVQRSRRHAGGYALRFPRILRWRQDLSVADVDTLEDVARWAATAQG